MVQSIINLGEHEDRVLTIVKGKFGLKNKSDAMNFIIDRYEKELLEPQLRPEYVDKIKSLQNNGKFKEFDNMRRLREDIENA